MRVNGGEWFDMPEKPRSWQPYCIPSSFGVPGDEDAHVRAWFMSRMQALVAKAIADGYA